MKVKRKVAALLALAMVVTGQPTMILADGLNGQVAESTVKTVAQEKLASDNDAKPSVPEDEREELVVTATDPEGATVNAPETIMTGETLEFNVVVEDGYEIVSVDVDGEELEAIRQSGSRYFYEAADILMDPEITVLLEEIPEFEYTETVGDLSFTLTAEEGVLPADTQVKIESLEDEGAVDTEEVKKEVLEKEGLSEEEAPVYGAYSISLTDEEGKKIPDKAAKKVTVSVSGIANLSETPELFDVGEANPIPTAVYKLDAVQNNSEEVDTLSEEPVQVKVTEKKAVKNSEAADEYTDVSFKLDNSFQRVAFAMNDAPKMLNLDAAWDIASAETVKVFIKKEGVAQAEEFEIKTGIIEENLPEVPGYDFVNATLGENGLEVVAVGLYQGDPYYSIDGHFGVLLGSQNIYLNYSAQTETVPITYEYDESKGTVAGIDAAELGENVEFTVKPNAGNRISEIKVNNEILTIGTGQTKFSFTVSGETTVEITFETVAEFKVETVPLGEAAENIDVPGTVNNGKTLVFEIETTYETGPLGLLVRENTDLLYIRVNDTLTVEAGEEADLDGMRISVSNERNNNTYTITISNVQQDLKIGYYIKDVKDAGYTISFLGLDGVTVYEWRENQLNPISEGETVLFSGGRNDVKYFYIKTAPGFAAQLAGASGEGFRIIERTVDAKDPGWEAALSAGCLYTFKYTRGTEYEQRTVYLKAAPIEYSAVYNTL